MSGVTTAKLAVLTLFELVLCACLFVSCVITILTLGTLEENVSFFVLHDLVWVLLDPRPQARDKQVEITQ